jgi:hypothetical protein
MPSHLPPHSHGSGSPSSAHPAGHRTRQGRRRPAAITRYQYAMALPSQGVPCAPQAAAKDTASGGWRHPQRQPPRSPDPEHLIFAGSGPQRLISRIPVLTLRGRHKTGRGLMPLAGLPYPRRSGQMTVCVRAKSDATRCHVA